MASDGQAWTQARQLMRSVVSEVEQGFRPGGRPEESGPVDGQGHRSRPLQRSVDIKRPVRAEIDDVARDRQAQQHRKRVGGRTNMNHYLAGKVPFKLADYKRWYQKLNIKRDET